MDAIRTAEDLLVEIGRGRRSAGENPHWIVGRIWKGDRARPRDRTAGQRARPLSGVIVRVLQERSFRRTAGCARPSLTSSNRTARAGASPILAEIEIWVLEYPPPAFVAGVRVSDRACASTAGATTSGGGACRRR